MRESLRLRRIAGFAVAVHWSVVVVVLLLAWSLADGVLPEVAPGRAAGTYWLYGVVGALLLLCSLLAHELSHAIVARRSGVEVDGLTLWMFGGVASLRGEPPTAVADLRIAAAGPATSVGLSVGFGAVAVVSGKIRGQTATMPITIEMLYNEYLSVAAFSLAAVLAALGLLTLALKTLLEWRHADQLAAGRRH